MIDKVEARDTGSLKTENLLMTYEDLAESLSMSVGHTKKLVKDHNAPRLKIGRSVRFEKDAISKWLKKFKRSHNVSRQE